MVVARAGCTEHLGGHAAFFERGQQRLRLPAAQRVAAGIGHEGLRKARRDEPRDVEKFAPFVSSLLFVRYARYIAEDIFAQPEYHFAARELYHVVDAAVEQHRAELYARRRAEAGLQLPVIRNACEGGGIVRARAVAAANHPRKIEAVLCGIALHPAEGGAQLNVLGGKPVSRRRPVVYVDHRVAESGKPPCKRGAAVLVARFEPAAVDIEDHGQAARSAQAADVEAAGRAVGRIVHYVADDIEVEVFKPRLTAAVLPAVIDLIYRVEEKGVKTHGISPHLNIVSHIREKVKRMPRQNCRGMRR